MILRVLALGRRVPAWVDAGFAEYAKRMPREMPVELIELKPEPRERGRSAAQILAAEAARVLAAAGADRIVALDRRGSAWTTRQLAERLQRWRVAGGNVAFAIGSADGLDRDLQAAATVRLALSAMTLPHGLARVLLAEQLYRAASLLAGHPYHRE
jgi:23S rRNA (pseudouridine1915-N3)-methyltransferase